MVSRLGTLKAGQDSPDVARAPATVSKNLLDFFWPPVSVRHFDVTQQTLLFLPPRTRIGFGFRLARRCSQILDYLILNQLRPGRGKNRSTRHGPQSVIEGPHQADTMLL